MRGQMMDQPLLISSLLEHAEACHGDTEIVSRPVEPAQGPAQFHRTNWRQLAARARQLANVLKRLKVQADDRIGTLAWNGYRHVELYYAIAGSGLITHTINPRLFPEQIAWIVNHADDRLVFFDINLSSLIEKLAPLCPQVISWIAMTDARHLPAISCPNLLCYEDLLAAESDQYIWPVFDERQASCLCYTSGTTGNPKGVLYSHRSTVLHTYAIALPDVLNTSARDTVLPVVPMFHVSAWGSPYAAALVGFKLVLPGPSLDGASLYEIMSHEAVTFSAGVPTVWLALLKYMRDHGLKLPALTRCNVGGSACPPSLLQAFRNELDIQLQPSWGMTEMSPLGAVNTLKPKHFALPVSEFNAMELKAGRVPFGVSAKIVDGDGNSLPRNGLAVGDLMVRGLWVADGYYRAENSPLIDGWFPTGDLATLDSDGFINITDRSKDVIKSGGEWISSIDLENIAMSHPGIAEAAVIGIVHPKWDERPLVIAVKRSGASVTRDDLLTHYFGRIAKWWTPDDVVFVDELPHNATGKVQKLKLREQFKNHQLPQLSG